VASVAVIARMFVSLEYALKAPASETVRNIIWSVFMGLGVWKLLLKHANITIANLKAGTCF
jgi:hypothetical protein